MEKRQVDYNAKTVTDEMVDRAIYAGLGVYARDRSVADRNAWVRSILEAALAVVPDEAEEREADRVEAGAARSDIERLIAHARDLNTRPDENQFGYGYRLGLWAAINLLVDAATARRLKLHPPPPVVGQPCQCGHYQLSHVAYIDCGKPTEVQNCFCGCQKFQPAIVHKGDIGQNRDHVG